MSLFAGLALLTATAALPNHQAVSGGGCATISSQADETSWVFENRDKLAYTLQLPKPTPSGLGGTQVSDSVATARAAIRRGDGPGALVAIGKLGRARSVESVPFLIENISYDPNPLPEPLTVRGIVIVPPRPWLAGSSHTDPFEHAPCVGALVSIGAPARRAVLDMAATEDRLDRLRAVAIVLRVPLGVAPAQAAVRRYAGGLDAPAKGRLAIVERLIGE